jgi:hypothetical protein
MITTGKISTSAIATLEAATGLRRAVVVIEQFANAAQIFKKTTRVANFSSSALHVRLAGGNLRDALQAASIQSTLASAAVPYRKAEEKRAAAPSSVTANAGTRASRNRSGIDALSVKAPWELATAFSLFYKILKLDRKPNANDPPPGKSDTEHTPATPTLSATSAGFRRGLAALEGASIATVTTALIRALDGIASGLDRLTRAARSHSMISAAIPATALALIGLGGAQSFVLRTLRPFSFRGFRDVFWLLRNLGVTRALRWLGRLVTKVVEVGSLLADLSLGWDPAIAALVGLAVADYQLYRHWNAAKRLLSPWIESAHKAIAGLMKWMADKIRNAAGYAGHTIASLTAALPKAPHSFATAAATAHDMNRARAVAPGAAVARPAPMMLAVRRAVAATAFATPLMLAGAGAGAFASPAIFTNDAAPLRAPLSPGGTTQGSIVIDYAPNVAIHCEDATDSVALKRRVMEILERHGRELHQVLAREIVRQQRRDFQPRYSNE